MQILAYEIDKSKKTDDIQSVEWGTINTNDIQYDFLFDLSVVTKVA